MAKFLSHSQLTLFLSLKIKYKEEYEKSKGKVMGTTDSRLLHSLQVAKMSSEVNSFLPPSPRQVNWSCVTLKFFPWASFAWNCYIFIDFQL